MQHAPCRGFGHVCHAVSCTSCFSSPSAQGLPKQTPPHPTSPGYYSRQPQTQPPTLQPQILGLEPQTTKHEGGLTCQVALPHVGVQGCAQKGGSVEAVLVGAHHLLEQTGDARQDVYALDVHQGNPQALRDQDLQAPSFELDLRLPDVLLGVGP